MTGCPFCAIARGEVDAALVYEDRHSVAFLDHRPVFPGHTLLVPRAHVEVFGDLPDDIVQPYFVAARTLARAVERGLEADGTFVGMNNRVSQSVPHLHVHIVPRKRKDGLRGFFWPRTKYRDDEHLREVQEAIRSALAG